MRLTPPRPPAALATLAVAALAIAGAESARGSGLLLGTDQHRSLWIWATPTGISVLEIPGIVIPRRTGFWRLHRAFATWPDSSTDGPGGAAPKVDSEELWSFAPAGRPPAFKVAPGRALVDSLPDAETCEETSLRPTFIGPRWIAYERTTNTECGVHPDGGTELHVAPLDRWRQRYAVTELLGREAIALFHDSLAAGAVRFRAAAGDQACEDPEWDEQKWAIARDHGRWIARGWADAQRICGYGFAFATAAVLPESLVAANVSAVSWQEVVRAVPAACDAMVSPAGDLLVVLSPNQLCAFTLRDGKIVTPAARRAFGVAPQPSGAPTENAVLIEWALGRSVERWTRELTALGPR